MSDLGFVGLDNLFFVDDDGVGTSAAAEDATAAHFGANIEDLGAQRDHVDGKAVAARGCLCRQHTRVDDAAHAGEKLLGNAGAVALDLVTGAHAIGGNNVRLLARRDAGDQGKMGSAVGVIFDALDHVLAGLEALVVDDTDTALVAATPMTDRDAAGVVATAQMLTFALDREASVGPTLPKVVVDGALEMAQAGSAGLVGAQRYEFVLARALGADGIDLSSDGDG